MIDTSKCNNDSELIEAMEYERNTCVLESIIREIYWRETQLKSLESRILYLKSRKSELEKSIENFCTNHSDLICQ